MRYRGMVLAMFILTSAAYSENVTKLKADIQQKEKGLTIKISKDGEDIIETKVPEANGIIHKIIYGDTLSQISLEYKKSIKKIAADNNIKNIDMIIAGKTLIIK